MIVMSQDPRIRPKTQVPEVTSTDEALDVQTVVIEERGRWAVEIIVVFADGVVRKRINTNNTKARAELSANLIIRAAERYIRGPLHG